LLEILAGLRVLTAKLEALLGPRARLQEALRLLG
jgi:hypothetical protein